MELPFFVKAQVDAALLVVDNTNKAGISVKMSDLDPIVDSDFVDRRRIQ